MSAKPVKLSKLNVRDAWLGDPDSYEVAAYSDFKGSKSNATWIPDETTALVWAEYLKSQ